MTVTRHFKKITSFLSFSFAASPAGRDFPHADDALLRPPPRVAERREVLLNKSKTFFKNALQTLPFIHGDCTETVKTLRKTWRSFETSTNFPRGVNTLLLYFYFFLFLRLAVWTLLCSSIISKAQRMTFHQRGT